MPNSSLYLGEFQALFALHWPTYADTRQARNIAAGVLRRQRGLDLPDLAARLSRRLGCLPGILELRPAVKPQEFEGLYGSLERRLNARLDRLERDEKLRPYTVTAIARKDGLPGDMTSLHKLGRLIRKAVGEPVNGPCPIWHLPEDLFIGTRFKD